MATNTKLFDMASLAEVAHATFASANGVLKFTTRLALSHCFKISTPTMKQIQKASPKLKLKNSQSATASSAKCPTPTPAIAERCSSVWTNQAVAQARLFLLNEEPKHLCKSVRLRHLALISPLISATWLVTDWPGRKSWICTTTGSN